MSPQAMGRQRCRGVPGRAPVALRCAVPVSQQMPARQAHCKCHPLEREAVRAGASVFFFLWEVAEHILDNHFMLLGSGA